jgi:hypothetical protein
MARCLKQLVHVLLIIAICLVILRIAPALLGTLILLWLLTKLVKP